ncbi:hypothetical protein [Variovorax paradoxus]|uniref:Uncharacterized protein n=1 Tax=Variovorax paradoxus TaxID=34073 RepID=A0A679JNG7_VARPD|nr:hypothetical protein VVAX_04377 [Variovorax paradoxus]
MTTIKHSYPGQWGSIPTATERDEADEFHELQRTGNATIPVGAFIAIGVPFLVAVLIWCLA